MKKHIVILGVIDPLALSISDVLGAEPLPNLMVNTYRGYNYAVADKVIPESVFSGVADFVSEERGPDYYVRNYEYIFYPVGYPDEAQLGFSVMVSDYAPGKLIVNVTLDDQFVARRALKPLPDIDMGVAIPKFVVEQFSKKLPEVVPSLSVEQVTTVAELMHVQLRDATKLPDEVLHLALVANGCPEDLDLNTFNAMLSDVGAALSGLGIDIVEPDAKVLWSV